VPFVHKPVLLTEVMELLNPRQGQVMVDCTAGGGGHSKVILEKLLPGGHLIALDQDQSAVEAATKALKPLGESNFTIVHSNFQYLADVLDKIGTKCVDGILFDLGVSSHQLDEGERGFSYQHNAPLDMRMDRSVAYSARELVNEASADELARIIWEYGEERWAKRIAAFIFRERTAKPIETTGELAEIIKSAIPSAARREGPHPAKRTFQALRIAVNDELGILGHSLEQGIKALKRGGRVVVITFHSLEDRLVKQVMQKFAQGCICPRDLPVCICNNKPQLRIITTKPVLAQTHELEENPRSRSAKLRAAEKL